MKPYQLDFPNELLDTVLDGDWVIDPRADRSTHLVAIATMLREHTGQEVGFTAESVERPSVVVTGRGSSTESKPLS